MIDKHTIDAIIHAQNQTLKTDNLIHPFQPENINKAADNDYNNPIFDDLTFLNQLYPNKLKTK